MFEADQVAVRVLAFYSAHGRRDLLSLPVGDFVTGCFHLAVGFGLQSSVALATPGAWCVVGSLDERALLGRPSPLVFSPHPAGLLNLLAPFLGCGLLFGRDPLPRGGLFRGNGRPQVGVVLLSVAGLGIRVTGPVRLAAAVILVVS